MTKQIILQFGLFLSLQETSGRQTVSEKHILQDWLTIEDLLQTCFMSDSVVLLQPAVQRKMRDSMAAVFPHQVAALVGQLLLYIQTAVDNYKQVCMKMIIFTRVFFVCFF